MKMLSDVITWIIAVQIILLVLVTWQGPMIAGVYALYDFSALYGVVLSIGLVLIVYVALTTMRRVTLKTVGSKSKRAAGR